MTLSNQSITLAKNAGIDTIAIFSFEMKREINGGNVRECYFQAVSNSSFEIGVIRLDVEDVHQSEILLPSRDNDLDIGMINDLSSINPDFAGFITTINDSMQVGHFVKGKYDPVLGDDQLKKRCGRVRSRCGASYRPSHQRLAYQVVEAGVLLADRVHYVAVRLQHPG